MNYLCVASNATKKNRNEKLQKKRQTTCNLWRSEATGGNDLDEKGVTAAVNQPFLLTVRKTAGLQLNLLGVISYSEQR